MLVLMTFSLLLLFILASPSNAAAEAEDRTFVLDSSLLAHAKQQIDNNASNILQSSLKQLLAQANLFLTKKAISVVEKIQIPPSGNKHDYYSLSPYYWPDPTKPNGLPYILHDGIVNPQVYSIPDKRNLEDMIHRIKILALAYYFTDNPNYASKAVELLRAWFLSNNTKMNSNLQYAGVVPGRSNNSGSSTGIMDLHDIPNIIDSIGLIQYSYSWSKQDQLGMDLWFSRYLDWLLNSDFGKKEAQAIGNHGAWYDVQTSSIALFLNKTDIAKNILESSIRKLIPEEIQPDGRQPFELKRTNSWDYSTFNLQGLFELANVGQHVGLDLWNHNRNMTNQAVVGASKPLLQSALDYLIPYALKKQAWSYPQIALPISTKGLSNLLCQATIHYPNNSDNNQLYTQAFKSLNSKKDATAVNTDCNSYLNYLF
jgi:hypothetical protein